MHTRAELERRDDRPAEDHFVRIRGATWADYQRLVELRGERAVPRLTYLEGLLEIMSPSNDHERIKGYIGRLVEQYCLLKGVRFTPFGSWTIQDREAERGAEPDECYVFGDERPDRPHLAIEVVWTSGGVDKLEVYRELGVQEVWYWRKGKLQPYVLREDGYAPVPRSEALPDLDLDLLCSFLDRPTAYDAIQEFRAALGGA